MRSEVRGSLVFAVVLSLSCGGGPEGPSWEDPGGPAIAWFDGLGYTVDLYFPRADSLICPAFVTGEVPSDITPIGGGAFAVVNSTSSTVSFFDLDDSTQTSETELPGGSNPYASCASDGRLYVALLMADSIAVIDIQTGSTAGFIPVGENPDAVAAASGRLFVGHGNYPHAGSPPGVSVVDLATGQIVDTIPAPENVTSLRYFGETGRIHAASTTYSDDGAITVIDPDAMTVTATIQTGGTPGLPDLCGGSFVAGDGWTSDKVYIYSEEGTLEDVWSTGSSVTGLAARGDTLYMTDFAGDRVVVGLLSGRILLDTLAAGDGPQGVAIIPR
jgi:hypothetical protein